MIWESTNTFIFYPSETGHDRPRFRNGAAKTEMHLISLPQADSPTKFCPKYQLFDDLWGKRKCEAFASFFTTSQSLKSVGNHQPSTINHHPLSSWYLSIILSLMAPFWWFCQVTPARPADMVEMALVVVVVGTWVFGHGRKMEGKCEKILGKYGKTYYKWRFIAGENLL